MHELAITKEIVRIILKECKINKIKAPKKITLDMGSLTTYKSGPLKFYFDALKSENMIISVSELAIRVVKGRVRCNNCKIESFIDDATMVFCSKCGSFDVTVIDGKDLKIRSIDY